MSSRIRIKMGAVEIEYEGTDDFLREELLPMVKAVASMYHESADAKDSAGQSKGTGVDSGSGGQKVQGTTNQIATNLGISKRGDLIFAAGAKLHFVDGKSTFTRQEILDEAKTATTYFKASNHQKNLTPILQGLVSGGKFNEPSKDTYALTQSAISAAKGKLAQ